MSPVDLDQRVRLAALVFLAAQIRGYREVLPRYALATGFTFDGTRVPLIGPQGIIKPAILIVMLLIADLIHSSPHWRLP